MRQLNVMKKIVCGIMVGTMLFTSTVYADTLGNNITHFSDEKIEIVGGSVILHFDSKGGSKCEDVSVGVGVSPECTYKLPSPTRKGYTFVGWYTKAGIRVTNKQSSLSQAFKIMHAGEEGTVYAKWIKNTVITDVTVNTGKNISVTWKNRSTVDKYEVQIATNKNFKNAKTITTTKNSINIKYRKSYLDKSIFVRVRTVKKIGNREYKSNYARTITI